MNSNLKVLGLALVAALALSALAAGAAQAETAAKFWSQGTTIDLRRDSPFEEFASESGGVVKCSELEGHAEYEGESAELTAHEIGYKNCTSSQFGITFPATIIPTGGDCHLTFTAGTKTAAGGDDGRGLSHGSAHICALTINIYNSPHPSGAMRCQIHIPAQTLNNITFINKTTEGVMAVTIEGNSIPVSETKTSFPSLGCNSHVTDSTLYSGKVWAKATNALGQYVDITVT